MDDSRLIYQAENNLIEKKYRLSNRYQDSNTKIIPLPTESANHKFYTKNSLINRVTYQQFRLNIDKVYKKPSSMNILRPLPFF